jgi:hypothetical protein
MRSPGTVEHKRFLHWGDSGEQRFMSSKRQLILAYFDGSAAFVRNALSGDSPLVRVVAGQNRIMRYPSADLIGELKGKEDHHVNVVVSST